MKTSFSETNNRFRFDHTTVRVPTLLIFGDRDVLIPVRRSVEIINEVYANKANLLTVTVYPNANHFIKTVPDPQSFEWSKFADGYLENLIAWIKKQIEAD